MLITYHKTMLKINNFIIKIIGINTKRVGDDLFVHPSIATYLTVTDAINDTNPLNMFKDIESFMYNVSENITISDLYIKLKTTDKFKDSEDFSVIA